MKKKILGILLGALLLNNISIPTFAYVDNGQLNIPVPYDITFLHYSFSTLHMLIFNGNSITTTPNGQL